MTRHAGGERFIDSQHDQVKTKNIQETLQLRGGLMTMNSQVSINSRGNGERTNPIESNQIKVGL